MPRKKLKRVVPEPAGKDLKAFQATFGNVWRQFVNSPAFQAGMQYLRNKKLEEVSQCPPDYLNTYGVQLHSELKGFLQLENRMYALPEMEDFSLPVPDESFEYLSPEQEAEMQQLQQKFREETKKQRYA